MSNKKQTFEWNEDYLSFISTTGIAPPRELSDRIKKAVKVDLNPSPSIVIAKLLAIHVISGGSTLFLCPQFDVTLHHRIALYETFRKLGEYGCMIACGALFLGATGLVSAMVLKASEIRVIRSSLRLQWLFLSFISVGFFLAFQEQERIIPMGLLLAWFLGCFFGAVSFFRLGYLLRLRLTRNWPIIW